MSSPSSPSLVLDVASRRFESRVALLAVAAGLSAAAWLALGGAPALAVLTSVALGVVIVGLRRAGWLGGERRLVKLAWLADGQWLLTDARGRSRQGVICSDTRVGKAWVWLRWNTLDASATPPPMLLARTDMPREDFRRLKVRLRVEGARSAADVAMRPFMTMRDPRRKRHAFRANFLGKRQSTDAVRGGPRAASCRRLRRSGSVAR